MLAIQRLFFLLLLLVIFSGCSSTAKLTRQEIMQQYSGIAELQTKLDKAQQAGVDYLAPEGYRMARESLEAAVTAAGKGIKELAERSAEDGLVHLKKAQADADQSRVILREVLEIRQRAIQANADNLQMAQFNELETDLKKAAHAVERGDAEDAKEARPDLMAGYSLLELSALKKDATELAKQEIAKAKEQRAKKFAPKTLKLAEEELALALSVLEANRTHVDKAKTHALRSIWHANRSIEVVELVKYLDQNDFTPEEIVLWYQDQLSRINQPAGDELPFNKPNHEVVELMQQKIASLHEAIAKVAILEESEQETRKDLQNRLESIEKANREAQARYDKIQQLFTESEANVYRQGHNVLLETHAFYFPVGGSEIQSQNYDLLNKIVEAIRVFPSPSIIVRGHTDSTGSDQNNLLLSQKRADKVAAFLGKLGGIDVKSIVSTGYGESHPVASNETEAGRALNRRIEVLIVNQ